MATEIYEGSRPTHEGHAAVEMHGMAPIPLSNRYGRLHRVFTVWFTPNLVPAGFFIGTLATASFVGVGFAWGVVAIVESHWSRPGSTTDFPKESRASGS